MRNCRNSPTAKKRFFRWGGVLGLICCCGEAGGQTAAPPMAPLRQLEDYGYLGKPGSRSGAWWEPLKYVPLSSGENAPFLTLGGEVRFRFELIDNTDFGSGPQDSGGYFLTRYMPYLSLTVPELPGGFDLLVFGQVEAAFNDEDERGAGPIDEEGFDIIQLFVRLRHSLGDGEVSLQAGRQGISFGTERLLGSRYGPNLPLSFDGGLLRWKDAHWDVHGFYLRPVRIDPDPLNNISVADQQLWGVYATFEPKDTLSFLDAAKVDFYYLGYFDAEATYSAGTGRELRHTVGSRISGAQNFSAGRLDWNYEGILQFGSFDSQRGRGSILAWSAGTETGFTFDTMFSPRVAIRANIISGDENADDVNLQTFNPLFPKGKYFGELTPVGPYNLINILAAVGATISPSLSFSVQGGPYWRYSPNDAVYGVGGNIVRDSGESAARFIGTQLEFVAEWKPARELGFLVSYSQFIAGTFIEQTGPSETIHFFAVEAVLQF